MPVVRRPPPPASVQELKRFLTGLQPGRGVTMRTTARVFPFHKVVTSDVAQPFPVFAITVHDAATGHALASATEVGWRYFLGNEAEGDLAADILAGPEGVHAFRAASRSPRVAPTRRALMSLQGDVLTNADEYDARILDVPPLKLLAVWLHGTTEAGGRAEDILVCVPPVHPPFEAGVRYTGAEFDRTVARAAQRRLSIVSSQKVEG